MVVEVQRFVVWDGQTDSLLMPVHVTAAVGGQDRSSIGRPAIADLDGDSINEIVYEGYRRVTVLDDVMTLTGGQPTVVWTLTNSDASARTGITVFDFEADGSAEVVYRDQSFIFVYQGDNGNVLFQEDCRSGTRYEFPIIADVTGDGHTEILATCTPGPGMIPGGVKVWHSNSAPWVGTRAVWNQHGYNNTNIFDDLTVPSVPADNVTTAGGAFNDFLNQMLPTQANGDVVVAATDVNVTAITLDNANCPTTYELQVSLENEGDKPIPSGLYISVYEGDPRMAGATRLTTFQTDAAVPIGGTDTFSEDIAFSGTTNLSVVMNDPGTLAIPFDPATDFPISGTGECDFTDNVSPAVPVTCDTDGDGVPDGDDSNPADPNVCRDTDSDSCDDCSQTGADGSGGDPANDGADGDGDGNLQCRRP